MRSLTRYLLCLFVFSVPWALVVTLPGVGTISRLFGLFTIVAGVLTVVAERRVREPGVVLLSVAAFLLSGVATLAWTVSYGDTLVRAGTYVQFLGLTWVTREFARTREEQHALFLAFCLGTLKLVFDMLSNFVSGVTVAPAEVRYAASGTNPNALAYAAVVGFPMAWHLFLHHRTRTARAVATLYCLVAPVAVILSASRAAVIAGLVAFSIVPFALLRQSFSTRAKVSAALAVAVVAVVVIVPQGTWNRVLTIRQELAGGTMSGRTGLWSASWNVFLDRPVLGAGVGAIPTALMLDSDFGARGATPHNTVLAVLVEQGVLGLALLAVMVGVCARSIAILPTSDRQVWTALMLTALLFSMAGDLHVDKITWVLLGLLAARDATKLNRDPSRAGTPDPFARAQREQAVGRRQDPEPTRLFTSHHPRRVVSRR